MQSSSQLPMRIMENKGFSIGVKSAYNGVLDLFKPFVEDFLINYLFPSRSTTTASSMTNAAKILLLGSISFRFEIIK